MSQLVQGAEALDTCVGTRAVLLGSFTAAVWIEIALALGLAVAAIPMVFVRRRWNQEDEQ